MRGLSKDREQSVRFCFHRHAFFDYHVAVRHPREDDGPKILGSIKTPGQRRGNAGMIATRRHIMMLLAATILFAVPAVSYAETVRIGLPTKTYWPTTVAEAAAHQKLFEKEGITAEITIYRGGAECFEALAAGAADLILDAPSLRAAGRTKGVMSKAVANGSMGNFGWQLMVPAKSTLDVADLNGKKVAITSAGSGSDLLALWTIQDKKIDFTRVPVGGGGLVPNLLAGNVDAAVVYSPLSFQIKKSGEARTLIDYASAVPPNLTSVWIVTDKYAKEKPQAVQKALNALYGGLMFMRNNRDAAVKLIAELYEMPADIAAAEYENTILKLETDGSMAGVNIPAALQLSLDMAKMGGMKDLVPAGEIISTEFTPVPTKP
jgi:ABC-type nitrate/sulfonate/bicarbonate transport system substrate-binding protein